MSMKYGNSQEGNMMTSFMNGNGKDGVIMHSSQNMCKYFF